MFLLTNRNVLHLLAMAAFLHICQARSLDNGSARNESTNDTLWQPAEGTREEWLACRGMPKDVCERTKIKKQELQKAIAKKFGLDHVANDSLPSDSGVNQCIMFTEEQLDMMIAEAKKENATSAHRKKRTLIDHKKYPFSKWSMPVHYMFDGTHDSSQKEKIRLAFQHWADNTCIRFRELTTNARFNSNFIIIQKNETDGCWSSLGRIRTTKPGIPQPINLASYCVEAFGTVLHEIGHSLGLDHEQSRFGRDDSVRILWNNIQPDQWPQYEEASFTDALGLPYNYGSVMHYPSKNVFSTNGGDTMYALESLYRMNMGQRVALSFHDKKIINLGYCKGTCKTPLTQPCQRGGYQNPNKCSTCICPDGFSGRYCNEIASSQNANCGGEVLLNIASGTQKVISSPGYATTGYSGQQECTWWIKAPKNYTLELAFTDGFDIYCGGSACRYHWVEIKYKRDLGLEGARFCCNSRPSDIVISESNEMMVIFRSNYSLGAYRPRGFKAIVKSTPNGHRRSLFRCSFEKTSSTGNSLCGMTQGTADQFDWTVHHNATPSVRTGPEFPYDGDFYIYADANWPRRRNDEAKLLFPKLNFVGESCISFYYHMFGSNVKTLKLVRINKFITTVVWTKSGQIENNWLQASVGVYLSRCSQLQFVGIRGDGSSGDIGLDKIDVKSGPCAF